MNIHSNFIHNSQKVETIQVSINWWMDEPTLEYYGIHTMEYYSNKKEQTNNIHNNLDESLGNYAEWKKPT